MRFFIILCFTFFQAYGQELRLFVYDRNGNQLNDYEVRLNNNLLKDAHIRNRVTVNIEDILTLTCEGFKQQSIKITNEILVRSSYVFILENIVQEIEEVTIVRNKKEISGFNVVDYQPIPSGLILLKKSKKKTVITWISSGFQREFPIEGNANSIFLDALGTIHYTTLDSVYQFYLNKSNLEIIDVMAINDFAGKIKPIIYKNSDFLVYEKYSMDRKKYELIQTSKTEKTLFTIFDEERYKISMSTLGELISYYNANTLPVANLILNNSWSGKIKDLNIDQKSNSMIAWQNIMSLPIKCTTVKSISSIYTIDLNSGLIHKFDTLFHTHLTFKIQEKLGRNSQVLYDYYFDTIYLLNSENQLGKIYLFNQQTNAFEYITEISLRNFENFKVLGDTFYYLDQEESGYRHVQSVGLMTN